MPNCLRLLKSSLLLCLLLSPDSSFAEDFAAKIRYAKWLETSNGYNITADINYQLSPTAKEALQKGVPLSWDVQLKITHPSLLFDKTLYASKVSYRLQFNALLNQYEVTSSNSGDEMFLSLYAALNFMANLHTLVPMSKHLLKAGEAYQLAIKTEFNRELLPVPLRPIAYLDTQWFLSSDWFVWPIQK